ncbi:MAG TPA: hypothetical protein ENI81_05385, partial [Phycisphaerales bacterium]|nr:hypothetical protein [Phycisphaerales bacterium]
MRTNHPNRSWTTIQGGLPVATVVMIILATGMLRVQRPCVAKEAGTQQIRDSRPVSRPEPTYVPGEIIVKLADGQPGGTGLLSLSDTAGHEAALLRLQAVYGLSDEEPIFKGVRAGSDRLGRSDAFLRSVAPSSPRPSSC